VLYCCLVRYLFNTAAARSATDCCCCVLQVEYGKRVMDPAATTTTVSVPSVPDDKTYEYEMRSITESGAFSKPFAVSCLSLSYTDGPACPPAQHEASTAGPLGQLLANLAFVHTSLSTM
jgi:hypothetical protein